VRRLLVIANVVPSSPILVTLMKETPSSSDTSVLTRATGRDIPKDDILYNENYQVEEDEMGGACRVNLCEQERV
jgi:hypothetical protein